MTERPALAALLAAALLAAACHAPDDLPPAVEEGCLDSSERPAGLLMAGSGSNLPLTRILVSQYRQLHPEWNVQVPESIGSGGAIRALLDGAIDVGLTSRPLSAREEGRGLIATPFARTAIVLAAHGPGRRLSRAEAEQIFNTPAPRWPDGAEAVPVLREPGDSGTASLGEAWPELAAAMEVRRRSPGALVFYTDQEALDGISAIPGAIGVLDAGLIRLERRAVSPVAIDGEPPEATPDRARPARKTLYLVTRGAPTGEIALFLEYIRSSAVQSQLEKYGYLPYL